MTRFATFADELMKISGSRWKESIYSGQVHGGAADRLKEQMGHDPEGYRAGVERGTRRIAELQGTKVHEASPAKVISAFRSGEKFAGRKELWNLIQTVGAASAGEKEIHLLKGQPLLKAYALAKGARLGDLAGIPHIAKRHETTEIHHKGAIGYAKPPAMAGKALQRARTVTSFSRGAARGAGLGTFADMMNPDFLQGMTASRLRQGTQHSLTSHQTVAVPVEDIRMARMGMSSKGSRAWEKIRAPEVEDLRRTTTSMGVAGPAAAPVHLPKKRLAKIARLTDRTNAMSIDEMAHAVTRPSALAEQLGEHAGKFGRRAFDAVSQVKPLAQRLMRLIKR